MSVHLESSIGPFQSLGSKIDHGLITLKKVFTSKTAKKVCYTALAIFSLIAASLAAATVVFFSFAATVFKPWMFPLIFVSALAVLGFTANAGSQAFAYFMKKADRIR